MLWVYDSSLTDLNLENNPAMQELDIYSTPISSLRLHEKTPKLTWIRCQDTKLTQLNLSGAENLRMLLCSKSLLTSLNLNGTQVKELTAVVEGGDYVKRLEGNAYPITLSAEHTFDLSTLPGAFDVSKASEWKGGSVSGSLLTVDEGAESVSYTYDVGNDLSAEFTLTIAGIDPPDQPEQPEQYEITEGKNGSWTQESDGTLTVRASGPLDKFTGLQVDGKPVAPENYTAVSGSTVITLKKEFLKTLSAGTHKLTICFEDGACSTNLRIKPLGSPKTGESELRIWCSMLLTSCALICCVALIAKKRCCSH